MNKFAERLKILRNEKGYNQKELAKDLGVRQASIIRWKNGLCESSLERLVQIADYFQVSVD